MTAKALAEARARREARGMTGKVWHYFLAGHVTPCGRSAIGRATTDTRRVTCRTCRRLLGLKARP